MKHLKINIFLIGFLMLCPVYSEAQSNNFNAHENFFNAGSLYKKGDYKTAINLYEEILQNGLESGALYYNLGNSYLKAGDAGKAVLNYERARNLIPRDSDLESNYQYAVSLVQETKIEENRFFIYRFIHGHIDKLTVDELTISIFIFLLLMGIFYLLSLFLKWPSKISVSLITILCVLFFVHSFLLADKIHSQKNLAIALTNTDSKFEPIDGATTYFEISEGSKVQILKEKDDWIKIQRSDKKTGWSKKDQFEKITG